MKTVPTANPSQARAEATAFEKPLDGFLDHRPQGTIVLLVEIGRALLELVPVAFQTRVEGGAFRMPLQVGNLSRAPLAVPRTRRPSSAAGRPRIRAASPTRPSSRNRRMRVLLLRKWR